MKRQNLIPKAARKFKVTTDSKHSLPVSPNLLDLERPVPKLGVCAHSLEKFTVQN